jgi:hypothetical protein
MDTADLVSVSLLIKTQFPQIVLTIRHASIILWVKDEEIRAIRSTIDKYFHIRLETSFAHEVKWVVGAQSFGMAKDL